jgi:hypothetical protein
MFSSKEEEIWENLTEDHRKVVSEALGQDKCIKRLVLNAARNVKFHSNLQKAGLFFAKNVLEVKEDFNSKILFFIFSSCFPGHYNPLLHLFFLLLL